MSSPDLWSAVRLSLLCSGLALVLTAPLAVGLGWLLARRRFVGRGLLTLIVMAPLVVPPVVTGLVLLRLFSPAGPLGALLRRLGCEVAFAPAGVVLAAAVVGLPLFVQSARSAFEAVDPRLEEVGRNLGWAPWQVWRRVSLPLAWPGLLAGAVLAFARALGEFGATAVLSGDIEGRTRTIPMAVYALLELPSGDAPTAGFVGASLLLALASLLLHEVLVRRHRARLAGGGG